MCFKHRCGNCINFAKSPSGSKRRYMFNFSILKSTDVNIQDVHQNASEISCLSFQSSKIMTPGLNIKVKIAYFRSNKIRQLSKSGPFKMVTFTHCYSTEVLILINDKPGKNDLEKSEPILRASNFKHVSDFFSDSLVCSAVTSQ